MAAAPQGKQSQQKCPAGSKNSSPRASSAVPASSPMPECAPTRAGACSNTLSARPNSSSPIQRIQSGSPSSGGFACCGHPSSFHDEEIRKLREQMTAEMIHLNILPMNPSEKLEKVFDRILYRVAGENAHGRILAPRRGAHGARDGHRLWRLDQPQRLRRILQLRSVLHTDVAHADRNKGFAKIESAEEKGRLSGALRVHLAIPLGHMLVFYERLVHEVRRCAAGQCGAHDARLARHRRRRASVWPHPHHRMDSNPSRAPIKSAQRPRVFPTCYTNSSSGHQAPPGRGRTPSAHEFAQAPRVVRRRFQQNVLEAQDGGLGPHRGSWWHRIDANMDSLAGTSFRSTAPMTRTRFVFSPRKPGGSSTPLTCPMSASPSASVHSSYKNR